MTIWTPKLAAGKPAYLALAEAVAADRAAGRLTPGEKLPPHRELAYALGLTVGTVTRGYAEAARRGLTVGEVGRGTFVAGPTEQADSARGFAARPVASDDVLNLSITRPAAGPMTPGLAEGLRRLATRPDLAALADYGHAEGRPEHRAAVANWLTGRGAPVTADRVVIASGAQNALALAAAGLLRPGDAVAVDPLTYPGFKTAAALFGLRLVAVPGDGEGMRPDALAAAAAGQGVRAVYLMANLHNPTGAAISPDRRAALAGVAEAADLLIIEDDVYGFLIERPAPSFAALAPERTALVGAVSKFMAPALRFGWLVPPEGRVAEVASALRGLAWMASPLLADVAAAALASGEGDELATFQRQEAAARMAIARRHLGPWLPATPDAAMHVWLPLPEPWRTGDFVAEAEARRVAVTGAGAFAVGRGAAPHAIRFGLGPADRGRLEEGMKTLAGLLSAPPRGGVAVV